MAEPKKQEVKAPEAPGTSVVSWQAELAALTTQVAETEKPSGNWVSFKGGQLTIGGNRMPGDKAKVIVVGSVFENQWYKERYDPNNPTSPHCYAIAEHDEDLKPHPDAADPQAPSCAECPKNAWKSDPNGGKGKACKNVRRLALLSEADLDDIEKAEFAVAKMPVTSVKNWSTYANQIANVLKLPPLAVITEMSVQPDPKTQLQVNFELVDKVPQDLLPALLAKRKDALPLLNAGYDAPAEAPAGGKKY
jgi:hypothetical protein